MAIHPTAIVDPGAMVAGDVSIGAYSVIGPQVEIGTGCRIGPHVVIQGPTRIGNDNQIFQFASIGDAPQDKKYKGEATRLEIGDRNVIREFCTMNRGTTHDQGITRVGSDNMFLASAHVAHDCVVGNNCVMSNNAALGGHVNLGDWVIMSAYSGIHQFCRIGAHAFLGNNAAVTVDIPPYVMAVGQPAKPHSVNSAGLKRRGFTVEQVRNIRAAYRILYRSGLKREQAIEQLTVLVAAQPELAALVDFFRSTSRRPRALR
jgi:UDP-N-acetylglucosamine acyltransferase